MLKKKPDFDSRNYGFLKLTALIEKYSDKFEIEKGTLTFQVLSMYM